MSLLVPILLALQSTGAPEPVEVRWSRCPERVALHEPFRAAFEVELAPGALERSLVEILNRPLDLPLAAGGAWFEPPLGLEVLGLEEPTPGASAVLGDQVGRMGALSGGEGRRFEAAAWLVARAPGALQLPPPRVRYATAEGFEQDLFGQSRPVGRQERFARGEARSLTVADWPPELPAHFIGAIGRFELEAVARPDRLNVGDELELVLHLRGDGGVGDFHPPARLDLPGTTDLGRRIVGHDPLERPHGVVELEVAYRLRVERAGVFDLELAPWAWLAPGADELVERAPPPVPLVVLDASPSRGGPAPDSAADGARRGRSTTVLVAIGIVGFAVVLAVAGRRR
jgi:hypothetical protein